MKNLTFSNWPTKMDDKIAGVYKITIDNQWFYIGSSKRVYKRLVSWKYKLINDPGELPYNVRLVCDDGSNINFELIEMVQTNENPKIAEDRHIKENIFHPFCLNRSISAFNTILAKEKLGAYSHKFIRAPLWANSSPVATFK